MKRLLLLAVIAMLSSVCYSQFSGKKIKCKNQVYVHNETGLSFPVEIEGLNRDALYSYDKKKDNVSADYLKGSLKVSVYVYPAQDGYEDRLRRNFLNCLLAVSALDHFHLKEFDMEHTSFRSKEYLIHGYRSAFPNRGNNSLLSLYECGHWWLKFRISDNTSDIENLIALEERMREDFNAALLVDSKPLNSKFDVYFQETAFRDSLMLGCVMGGAFAKVNWLKENLDSLETCAGIPSVYLEYYMAGFNGMLKFVQEHPAFNPASKTKEMVEYLKAVVDAGYLRELIANNRTVIAKSDSAVLNMEGFDSWVKKHPINEELFMDHAIISNK